MCSHIAALLEVFPPKPIEKIVHILITAATRPGYSSILEFLERVRPQRTTWYGSGQGASIVERDTRRRDSRLSLPVIEEGFPRAHWKCHLLHTSPLVQILVDCGEKEAGWQAKDPGSRRFKRQARRDAGELPSYPFFEVWIKFCLIEAALRGCSDNPYFAITTDRVAKLNVATQLRLLGGIFVEREPLTQLRPERFRWKHVRWAWEGTAGTNLAGLTIVPAPGWMASHKSHLQQLSETE